MGASEHTSHCSQHSWMCNESPSPTVSPDKSATHKYIPKKQGAPNLKEDGQRLEAWCIPQAAWYCSCCARRRECYCHTWSNKLCESYFRYFSKAARYAKGRTGWSQRRYKMERGGGKKKGSWVLVSLALARAPWFISGVQRQVPPFRHSILGTVQMKASTRHQHTEHNGPDPACGEGDWQQTFKYVQAHLR